MSKLDLVLAALPQCGALDCPEMANPRGGHQGLLVTVSSAGLSMRMQSHVFLCAKHSEEFGRLAQGGVAVS